MIEVGMIAISILLRLSPISLKSVQYDLRNSAYQVKKRSFEKTQLKFELQRLHQKGCSSKMAIASKIFRILKNPFRVIFLNVQAIKKCKKNRKRNYNVNDPLKPVNVQKALLFVDISVG